MPIWREVAIADSGESANHKPDGVADVVERRSWRIVDLSTVYRSDPKNKKKLGQPMG